MQMHNFSQQSLLIKAYDGHHIQIHHTPYCGPCLVSAAGVHALPSLHTLFDSIIALSPKIVLIACNSPQSLQDVGFLLRFQAQAIGIEILEYGAAYRTYNILAEEQRAVVLAILTPDYRLEKTDTPNPVR